MPRASSIKKLPKDVKAVVDRLLREGRVTQLEVVDLVNAKLDELGADPVSKSALNRYAVQMAKAGERIRQSREIAQAWIAELGSEPEGDVGRLCIELARTIAFDLSGHIASEGDEPASAKVFMMLAKGIKDLESAAKLSTDRELKIRQEVATKAADKVTARAKAAGLTKETIDQFRREILGVAET